MKLNKSSKIIIILLFIGISAYFVYSTIIKGIIKLHTSFDIVTLFEVIFITLIIIVVASMLIVRHQNGGRILDEDIDDVSNKDLDEDSDDDSNLK